MKMKALFSLFVSFGPNPWGPPYCLKNRCYSNNVCRCSLSRKAGGAVHLYGTTAGGAMVGYDVCSLVTRTRFTRYTFITSGGGYSKTVGYKRTLNWFRYIYLVPSPHLSNFYKIVLSNH